MSISTSEKLIVMRESERLTRKAMSELTGISYSSLTNYELNRGDMGFKVAQLILNHPKFSKYTMWFMLDQVSPKIGQISPALSHCGQEEIIQNPSDKTVG
ncbi:helix-turn-helix domain-containing protein [Photobacterium phosphoreum]|uniref:Transcriptional regulator n=1 Tax=Photobacterium phosphoreum TaxID=659 RepID=A0A2T3JKW7_PHOPO|nr:helix-turn-helix transcriptional regulator [Photobacterium phosphoreum]MCD9519475.1 transcriptional regulator [Photobacterium phosphoreum]PSU24464.1 transcriptional regulator [Photobacterium phosphoreum]PSU44384.1 transcriptional regulator [Photobacterium phosphoreum]PSU49664.1 transcriptional regulator [Photobacterium phosphoreum]